MARPQTTPAPFPPDIPPAGPLDAARRQFVDIWGHMGSQWGIPRTMAEVHALLFIEGRPMNTDEIMDRLQVSRGNVSMTLRALVEWAIVTRSHVPGDRKEYFVAEQDVWKMFRTIVRERKKREIDPLIESLRECRERTADVAFDNDIDSTAMRQHHERLDRMIEFMHTIDSISQRFVSPMGKGLEVAARILSRAS